MNQSTILNGDCLDMMRLFVADSSVDSIVTDPPYGLSFMGKRWDYDVPSVDTWREALRVLKPGGYLLAFGGARTYHRLACAIEDAGFEIRDQIMWLYGSGFPKSHNGEWGGTALKPAHEPIVVARKPLIGTVEANWREHGTGALNIDACRIGVDPGEVIETSGATVTTACHEGYQRPGASMFNTGKPKERGGPANAQGRWPANVIHDGSDEVLAAFPQAPGQQGDLKGHNKSRQSPNGIYGQMAAANDAIARGDSGSAARFFYCAKASKKDRGEGNNHPTVKPTDLMRYLCRLVTPPGGIVLDPFTGSGSTGKAAMLEGFRFLGIEREPEYCQIAEARIAAALAPLQKEAA